MFNGDLSNIYLLLYALAWATTLYIYWKKKRYFGAGILILSSYLFYAVVSFSLYNNPLSQGMFESLTLFPFIYLFCVLFLSLQPVLKYNEHTKIQRPSESLVNIISWSVVVVSLLILPNVLAHIQSGVTFILSTETGGEELYERHLMGIQTERTFLNYFYALSNITSDISVFLFFYYLTLPKKNNYLLTGLLIGVFTSILSSLADGLRTVATMKVMICFGSYFLLREHLTNMAKRSMKVIGIVLLSIVVTIFGAITLSRFSHFTGGAEFQIERYVGQANLNFNNYCLDAGGIRYGDRTCNIFKQMLPFDNVPKGVMETRAKYSKMKINDGSFSTFVGDFVLDFGPIAGCLILVFFSLMFVKLSRPKRTGIILFHQLLIVYFVMSVCIQGGMYLFYYSFKQNYVIMAYIFLYYLFRWDYNEHFRKKITVIHK